MPLENPLKFILTPGQRNGIKQAENLTSGVENRIVTADQMYDSYKFVRKLKT
ncbi:MAG: hypothetical protein AB8U25_02625 [Rickettsiales endosymbiont of Dermacentor nuttalli]